jgi:hypothetical protein
MKELSLGYRCLRLTSLLLSLLALVACAEFNSGWNRYSPRYNDPYAQSDFDELLAFGDNMARISPSARAKVCRTLMKRQKSSSSHAGIQLHLMVGRLLSDACGDISRILYEVRSIPSRNLSDTRMQRLVAIHTEALKRMHYGQRRVVYSECRQKPAHTVAGPKESSGSKNNETRLLREKLEAIRSMEKELDQSGDAP